MKKVWFARQGANTASYVSKPVFMGLYTDFTLERRHSPEPPITSDCVTAADMGPMNAFSGPRRITFLMFACCHIWNKAPTARTWD
ncbi:unnamed protein product [Peniophora sp. CBMAI 1063]|nr:unnamed protein product [Peniophora sp. CBMAI 1063]